MDCAASSGDNILERILLDEGEKPTDLPLSLLKEITNDFSHDREIGRGGFAVVYKGMLANGTVAVKKLSNTYMHEKKFHQEVECLMKVKHKNIVRFLGYCADTQGKAANYNGKFVMAEIQERLLCFEYLSNGSLNNYIEDTACVLEWRICYQIIKGICEGLRYLHHNYILHLDLKPANVLLDIDMLQKIADFGLSKCFHEKQSHAITSKLCGSLGYFAPESYSGRITFKSDIYSLGVIIIEILTREKGYVELEDVLEIWKNRLEKTHGDTNLLEQVKVCAVIGMDCIEANPRKRPDTQQIIDRLHEMESTIGSIEIGESSSLAAQAYNAFNDGLYQGSPKERGQTNSLEASVRLNQPGIIRNHQDQKQDQQRQRQSSNQVNPLSQGHTNIVQVILQNQMQHQQQQQQQKQLTPSPTQNQQGASGQQLPQSHQLQQQQLLLQQQQLNKLPGQLVNLASQQIQLSDQEQHQSLVSQSTVTLSRLSLIQEQQNFLVDMQYHLSNSHSLAQQQVMNQQDCRTSSMQTTQLPPPMPQEQQEKPLQKQVAPTYAPETVFPKISSTSAISNTGNTMIVPRAGQSAFTEDIPSCWTSPSTANDYHLVQPTIGRNEHCKINSENVLQSTAQMSILTSVEAVTATPLTTKELSKVNNSVKPSVVTLKLPNVVSGLQNVMNSALPTDNLETASSATSLWPSQTDGLLHQRFATSNVNQHQMFKDELPDIGIQAVDPSNTGLFGINNDGPLGFPVETEGLLENALDSVKYRNHFSTDDENKYRVQKDVHQEISTSMVSQSDGQSDMASNSIDSAINDGALLNRNSWAPAPPPKRMRTFTKVYKRGSVGRSIDIGKFSGYGELSQALARMFGIEGQLEDQQRIGWKLVYTDYDHDVLILGDDPWEEFVNCVKDIKILSPQEVQEMILDVDFGRYELPNQACSSSEGGNAWKPSYDQNCGNPSIGLFDQLE